MVHISADYEQLDMISGIGTVGILLFAYGLLMTAIIQFKLSRNPDFRRE